MLSILLTNEKQNEQIEHEAGPLEFGRGPQLAARRILVDDIYTSKHQLRVEELDNGRARLQNLSTRTRIELNDLSAIQPGECRDVALPVQLTFGATNLRIDAASQEEFHKEAFRTIEQPFRSQGDSIAGRRLSELGDAPAPESITSWLETVISLQHAAADTPEFFHQTARALVELMDLDLGQVLLLRDGNWAVAASMAADNQVSTRFSRTLLKQMLIERRTFYQDAWTLKVNSESLANVDCVVVSPIVGLRNEIVGALYGTRRLMGGRRAGGIRPLDAQIIQLLAAAVGANLVRTTATRTRVQFEQFFSPELVSELERDPALLEGRSQEVTILFSDLRGFTALAERLGAEVTCRVLRDLMERLSEQIVAQKGVIVDYAGDGILAMWNAPVQQLNHAQQACRAGLSMLKELPALNTQWQGTIGAPLQLGIGINTGVAQVGNTGSSRKLKYGPHGHTVNLASRIQSATKSIGAPLLIGASTRERLSPKFEVRPIGPVRLSGVDEEIPLFELHGERVDREKPTVICEKVDI